MKTKEIPEIKKLLKKAHKYANMKVQLEFQKELDKRVKFNSAANSVICEHCNMTLKPHEIAPHIDGNCPKGKDKTHWRFKDVQ